MRGLMVVIFFPEININCCSLQDLEKNFKNFSRGENLWLNILTDFVAWVDFSVVG